MDAPPNHTNQINNTSNSVANTNPETTAPEPQTDIKSSSQPIPAPRLVEIATEACDSTFDSVTSYEHSQTGAWNAKIINTVLESLISATTTITTTTITTTTSISDSPGRHPYKFAITSTIIQHTTSSLPSERRGENTGDLASTDPPNQKIGKRGMHSATGAFWDNTRDGCWSFKYEKPGKGFDVVVSVIWIAVDV